ncbi:N-acetylmuramoyl-L-alanine amidase [Chryseobacterium sp. RU37D]|uniref:N-acetylmuramoyl-L-alanine amidase n=1 Tax=Chryseobacterium sp. RU37D TaxID=1907397 RepID=UPI0009541F05|nr:N-acetylmuramoyl-L-alanine amidase [Chryseobacterium sp. RU37D]SIQ63749.1 N-acetylmuramoyl-L-alanine amidase [Chryseobacterium sp. RU37D]
MKGTKPLAISIFFAAFLSFSLVNKNLIVIDTGHGGNDIVANRNGIYEKNIVLNIGKEIQKLKGNPKLRQCS